MSGCKYEEYKTWKQEYKTMSGCRYQQQNMSECKRWLQITNLKRWQQHYKNSNATYRINY